MRHNIWAWVLCTHPPGAYDRIHLSEGDPCAPCNVFRLLVQLHPHTDQAVQGGVGVDEGVQRLVAFAVALKL